jgi:choline dehydrogenase-like flavoprotein
MDRASRICIVGGGPAGISAALYLQDAGFTRVTVLERAPDVGGKCLTARYDGLAHELGAVVLTPAYERTLELVERFGAGLRRSPRAWYADPRTGASREQPSLGAMSAEEAERFEEAALAWLMAISRHREHVGGAGYRRLPPELTRPFTAWTKENGAEALEGVFRFYLTGFGYGSLDQLPVAYVMKAIPPRTLANSTNENPRWPAVLADGYQDLMRRVGSTLRDLRVSHEVIAVERAGDVRVTTRSADGVRTEAFDALVVATPLDSGGLSWLPLTDDEARLFGQVRCFDYATTAARVDGLEAGRCYASILDGDRPCEPPAGLPCLFLRAHADSDVAIFYSFAEEAQTDEQIEAGITRLMANRGGSVRAFLETRRWRYFPHVPAEAVAAGWFDAVEALQGQNRTWFTGGQLDFDIVEGAVRYSRALVDRYFA